MPVKATFDYQDGITEAQAKKLRGLRPISYKQKRRNERLDKMIECVYCEARFTPLPSRIHCKRACSVCKHDPYVKNNYHYLAERYDKKKGATN